MTPPDHPFDQDLWTGRTEPSGQRYFQVVAPWTPNRVHGPSVALVGYACDVGVRRNGGRPGAHLGPRAFRRHLAKLPYRLNCAFLDAGDAGCDGDDLESTSQRMAQRVQGLVATADTLPLVVGGGHDVAWATYQGLSAVTRPRGLKLGVINFDAHFDLRDTIEGKGHSGSPFFQMAQEAAQHGEALRYLCLGIQPLANHDQLYERAQSLGVQWVEASDLLLPQTQHTIATFIQSVDALMLTICLDVLNQSVAPGVSAPQPLGISPETLLSLAVPLAQSPKLRLLEFAELNPRYDGFQPEDPNGNEPTARLVAALAATLLERRFRTGTQG